MKREITPGKRLYFFFDGGNVLITGVLPENQGDRYVEISIRNMADIKLTLPEAKIIAAEIMNMANKVEQL